MSRHVTIGQDDDGRRLDRVLRKAFPGLPLSALHRLLRTGAVRLDGKKARPDSRVAAGSDLLLPDGVGPAGDPAGPAARLPSPPLSAADRPPPGGLDVLFEGAGLLIVAKPAGLATHGPSSLETLVLRYLEDRLPPSLSFRPGPLHRLDKGTSGIVAFSAGIAGARAFSAALRERRLRKTYLAVLGGFLGSAETWEDELVRGERLTELASGAAEASGGRGGLEGPARHALSIARPLAYSGDRRLTLAAVRIGTGRRHQIRAQAAARGLPLAGDAAYGGVPLPGGFLLHAYELAGGDGLFPPIVAPVPARFAAFAEEAFGPEIAAAIARGLPPDALPDAIL